MGVASAEALFQSGDPEAAARAAEDAAAPLRPRQSLGTTLLLPAETLLVQVQALQGRTQEAARRLQALEASLPDEFPADRQPAVDSRLAFLAARAVLALADGRPADARRDLDTAIEAGVAAERVVKVLNLRLQRARALRDLADEPAARSEFATVARDAEALGLIAVADAARRGSG